MFNEGERFVVDEIKQATGIGEILELYSAMQKKYNEILNKLSSQSWDWQTFGPRIPDRFGILEISVFMNGGKLENPEKNTPGEDENQQPTRPTYTCPNYRTELSKISKHFLS